MILALILILLLPASSQAATIARPVPGKHAFLLKDRPGVKPKRLPAITHTGRVRYLLQVRRQGNWIGLRTPWRPARNVFWMHRSDLLLRKVRVRLLIDRSRRQISLWRNGKRMWKTSVVVGKPQTPTPVGLFALHDFYATRGDLRPFVFQTTAQSRVIRVWKGGTARIALHGRHGALHVPWGTALSSGCIRTPDWALRKIRKAAILGMPIRIHR